MLSQSDLIWLACWCLSLATQIWNVREIGNVFYRILQHKNETCCLCFKIKLSCPLQSWHQLHSSILFSRKNPLLWLLLWRTLTQTEHFFCQCFTQIWIWSIVMSKTCCVAIKWLLSNWRRELWPDSLCCSFLLLVNWLTLHLDPLLMIVSLPLSLCMLFVNHVFVSFTWWTCQKKQSLTLSILRAMLRFKPTQSDDAGQKTTFGNVKFQIYTKPLGICATCVSHGAAP